MRDLCLSLAIGGLIGLGVYHHTHPQPTHAVMVAESITDSDLVKARTLYIHSTKKGCEKTVSLLNNLAKERHYFCLHSNDNKFEVTK